MMLKAGAFVVCQEGQEVKSFRSNYFVFLFCTPLKTRQGCRSAQGRRQRHIRVVGEHGSPWCSRAPLFQDLRYHFQKYMVKVSTINASKVTIYYQLAQQ